MSYGIYFDYNGVGFLMTANAKMLLETCVIIKENHYCYRKLDFVTGNPICYRKFDMLPKIQRVTENPKL